MRWSLDLEALEDDSAGSEGELAFHAPGGGSGQQDDPTLQPLVDIPLIELPKDLATIGSMALAMKPVLQLLGAATGVPATDIEKMDVDGEVFWGASDWMCL